jgi:hypothetical protein
MAKQMTTSRGLRAITGATLLALGLLLFFSNLDGVAVRLGSSFNSSAGSFGTLFELGLAGLRAAQSYFFDHRSFLSGLRQILISFWPLTLVIIGITLLGQLFGKHFAASNRSASLPTYGDRS